MKDTTWPRLRLGGHLLPGLAAVGLFAVLLLVIVGTEFGQPAGFPDGAAITAAIGYAMFDLGIGDVPAEGFLAAFLLIAVVLDAALDGALMLAKREEDGSVVALLTDGGEEEE